MLAALAFLKNNWKLITVGWVCLLCFISGWYIRGNIAEAAKAKELVAEIDARIIAEKRATEISTALEKQLADSRRRIIQLNQRVGKEIAKNSIYNTCILPNGGVQLRNEAITRGKASR